MNSLCVDDDSAATLNGTKIQVFTCNSTNAQLWTVPGDGTLRVMGKCMRASGTALGSVVQLYDCTGTNVLWHLSGGRLVNNASGLCLEDPASGPSGTQLKINTCGTGPSGPEQKWTLP